MRPNNLLGRKFNRLLVVQRLANTRTGQTRWLCICECGNTVKVQGRVKRGHPKSCGCYRQDHPNRLSHGLSRHPMYRVYYSMMDRCYNPNVRGYKDYGDRGIYVCNRWREGNEDKSGVELFIQDMGERPSNKHSVDRIDNNGPYSPDNCRWAGPIRQANNKRSNITLTFQGKTLTLAQWADRTGVARKTLRARIDYGWTIEEILTTPSLTNANRAAYGKGRIGKTYPNERKPWKGNGGI